MLSANMSSYMKDNAMKGKGLNDCRHATLVASLIKSFLSVFQ